MDIKKAASGSVVAWPRDPRDGSIDWVCHWSLCACLHQLTGAAFRATLGVPDLTLLTPVQACNARALQDATVWFAVAGAGDAAQGPRPGPRVLAGVALASAVAIHCLSTWLLLVTAPNDYLLLASLMSAVAFIIFAVVDANAAVILLRRPGGEERAGPPGTGSRSRTEIRSPVARPEPAE